MCQALFKALDFAYLISSVAFWDTFTVEGTGAQSSGDLAEKSPVLYEHLDYKPFEAK